MIGFLAVAVVVIVAPGPDFALTLKNSMRGGGAATALGVVTGQVVWVGATAAGVAALLAASHPAFVALRLVGAVYLVWLGLATLLARGGHTPRHGAGSPFRQGLLSNLANPKMAVFFTSLLPQFGTGFAELLGLGLVFSSLTLLWLSAYALAVARTRQVLVRGRVRRALDALSGLALAALGIRLAAES